MSEGGSHFCENCGTETRQTTSFCPNCGTAQHPDLEGPNGPLAEEPTGPLAPILKPGRISTPDVPNVPPPPAPAAPAQGGTGGFLRSFGLGAGTYIGMAVALLVLLVIAVGVWALFLADTDSSRTMEKIAQQLSGGKQEATGEVSLQDLIPNQVGDYTLQTNEPYELPSKAKESSPETRRVTYESSEGDEVIQIVGILTPRYAYSEQTTESERFIDGFLEAGVKGLDLGVDPKRSEFQVTDASGKQVGRGVLVQGTESDAVLWVNERLSAVVKAPAGEGQNFYDDLPY